MRRHTPLRTYTTLRRHVPLLTRSAPESARPQPAVPDDVRAALTLRSGGWCEMRLPGCQGRAIDPAHRIARGMGGRHRAGKAAADRLSGVVHACRACHDWCHARPAQAYELGLMLRTGQDPAREPVLLLAHHPLPVYLDDAGGIHTYEEAGL